MVLVDARASVAKTPATSTKYTIYVEFYPDLPSLFSFPVTGEFKSIGAISDRGYAFYPCYNESYGYAFYLDGRRGDLVVKPWVDVDGVRRFTIVAATGEHAALVGLIGTTRYEERFDRKLGRVWAYTFEGLIGSSQ